LGGCYVWVDLVSQPGKYRVIGKESRDMKQTEAEFFERLNKLEKETSSLVIPALCACAFLWLIIGFVIGYYVGVSSLPIGR